MTTDTETEAHRVISPEEAFTVLGDQARFEILQALGKADDSVGYSDLFERIEYNDRSNFSYHLDKLVGHFVAKVDGGYALRRPGERVLEAIHSGAVTTDPVRELTRTDRPCPFCSAPIEVGYEQERVTMHCLECQGLFRGEDFEDDRFTETGNLGFRPLPPAAVDGRTAGEIHDVSKAWITLTMHAASREICPRCSGRVNHSVAVCDSHDASEGTCDTCGNRFEARASVTCTNCTFDIRSGIPGYLLTRPEVMAFLIDNEVDPIAAGDFHPYAAAKETILSHSPFEAQYIFTVEEDTLTVTVDEDLSVVDTMSEEMTGESC